MKLLLINTLSNSGSTGRISEDIGKTAIKNGFDSYMGYGRDTNTQSELDTIKIGSKMEFYSHLAYTRFLDRHGFGSTSGTKDFLETVKEIDPDIIHLHNIHGYYLNIELLFEYIKSHQKKVVWTLHDCWAFTGHCTYFDQIGCNKWEKECYSCPKKSAYPTSWLMDNSKKNFGQKKTIFNGVNDLTIVTPSYWLKNLVKRSFLQNYPVKMIHNGIDLNIFHPTDTQLSIIKYQLENKNVLLGVASLWNKRKGLADFIELSKILPDDTTIVLVGLTEAQIKSLPENIIGIRRTENISELAKLYSLATVFINPTYEDNFPTTNIEALACGTPIITYKTGGSPEAVDEKTGFVLQQGDVKGIAEKVKGILSKGKEHYRSACRDRAIALYKKEDRYQDYINLYNSILN